MEDNLVEEWLPLKEKYLLRLEREELPESVRRTFKNEMCMSSQFAKAVFEEYKRFLLMQFLCRADTHFVEPDWIRQMRHCHIIETKKYAEFCFKVF